MSAQAASIGSLLSSLLLSDYRVLRLSWNAPFAQQIGWSKLREPVYLAFQPWAARFPDHVFDSAWNFLAEQNPDHDVVLVTLQSLINEFIELRNGKVRVRRNLYGAWQQGLSSRLSSLPIQAAAGIELNFKGEDLVRTRRLGSLDQDLTPWRDSVLPLLRPEEAPIADYIEREGLHETHLHLNGSTHAEICWLRAIRDSRAETRDFVAAWTRDKNKGHIRELVAQINPDLTPQLFHQHLQTASRLRYWLMCVANEQIAPDTLLPESCQSLYNAGSDEWSEGLSMVMPSWRAGHDIGEEFTWMVAFIAKLRARPSVQLSRMFHTYLLLLNQYYKLLVQGEAHYGFDQFQKFTLTELREPAELEFRARFHAMHGPKLAFSKVGYLEGRFAPKTDPMRACRLFQSILGGYLNYVRDSTTAQSLSATPLRSLSALLIDLDQFFERQTFSHRQIHRLALVAHFIKQDWSPKKGKSGPYRHYLLDMQIRRSTNVLLSMLARWPRLGRWVRGIDAASNELHAPPDVFAPVFRVCRKAGLSRCTYHAGEDFRHLLSGIATMWEALEILDLRNGDRIGHGTAMGIRPSLWLERMPGKITLPRGEWMLSLLAAWQLLRDVPGMQACVNNLQRELELIAHKIFGYPLTVLEIERAMMLRGLSRRDLMIRLTSDENSYQESLSDHWREEAEKVESAYRDEPDAVRLLWQWLSNAEVLKRAFELVETDAEFMDGQGYLKLQQALMQKIADRGVLIETLPSSNVRISQYHHIGEHHSLRWMRIPGYFEDGDPEVMVCLGSDDPGIFASDLETEFYLLYATLRKLGLNDSDALHRLSILNERGRIYRFHHPLLS